jgi:hypothetical protein
MRVEALTHRLDKPGGWRGLARGFQRFVSHAFNPTAR